MASPVLPVLLAAIVVACFVYKRYSRRAHTTATAVPVEEKGGAREPGGESAYITFETCLNVSRNIQSGFQIYSTNPQPLPPAKKI